MSNFSSGTKNASTPCDLLNFILKLFLPADGRYAPSCYIRDSSYRNILCGNIQWCSSFHCGVLPTDGVWGIQEGIPSQYHHMICCSHVISCYHMTKIFRTRFYDDEDFAIVHFGWATFVVTLQDQDEKCTERKPTKPWIKSRPIWQLTCYKLNVISNCNEDLSKACKLQMEKIILSSLNRWRKASIGHRDGY